MIGLYCRLSQADGERGLESGSISNQRAMLLDYVTHDRELSKLERRFFIDDGFSGTRADNRPALQEMLALCTGGVIDTVIVKDLSRLARDELFCVDLVEDRLPALGVRVIAVADSYDSAAARGDANAGAELAFKSVMNSLYSRDLSQKVTQSIRSSQARGENLNTAPFGYTIRRKGEPSAIDPTAGPWARHVYELALDGMSQSQIAKALNAEEVPTPGAWRAQRTGGNFQTASAWTGHMVKSIVTNPHYKGTLVLGKCRASRIGGAPKRTTAPEERNIFENAHEALVTPEEWDRAQLAMTSSNAGGAVTLLHHPFAGKIACPHCGRAASYRTDSRANPRYALYCRCTPGTPSVALADLEAAVNSVIGKHLECIYGCGEQLRAAELDAAEKRRLQALVASSAKRKLDAYESYRTGKLGAEGFKARRAEIDAQATDAKRRLGAADELERRLYGDDPAERARAKTAIKLAGKLKGERGCTREKIEAFVDKVYLLDDDSVEIRLKYEDVFERFG